MACALIMAAAARGHFLAPLDVEVSFKADGAYQIDMACDVDAALLGLQPGHVTEESYRLLLEAPAADRAKWIEEYRQSIPRTVHVVFDGKRVQPESISFPELGKPKMRADGADALPGMIVRLAGKIPPGAEKFIFWASRSYGNVNLTIASDLGGADYKEMLEVANDSPPYLISGRAKPPARLAVAGRYLRLGYEHILPQGLDHILFVLGLFLLGTKLKPLLFQVTAFTLAHSVTLGLAMYGILSLPSRVVEPLIAVSIVCVAAENVWTAELHWWRPAVVFGFGLLHGLGFAGALAELGLPRERFAVALAAFNVGVEAGQLTVILAALLAVGWFRRRSWYRPRIAVPVSCAIGVVALYWTIQRVFMPQG